MIMIARVTPHIDTDPSGAVDAERKTCVNCDVPHCADCNNGDGVCYTCRSGFFRVVLDPPSNQDVVCLTGLGAYSIDVAMVTWGERPRMHGWFVGRSM
jgi:hypothetical protein